MEGDGIYTAEFAKGLSLITLGKVRSELKTPSRDGNTQVTFEPLDSIARLATLVPSPDVNPIRYYWLFPRSCY